MCPACKFPMVGTNPTRLPARRAKSNSRRRSATVDTTIMVPLEAMLGAREGTCFDSGHVGLNRRLNRTRTVHKIPRELGARSRIETQHVMQHSNLVIDTDTS